MDRMIYLVDGGREGADAAPGRAGATTWRTSRPSAFAPSWRRFAPCRCRADGAITRVYALESTIGHDHAPGAVQATGRPLDVAMKGNAWLAVQGLDGTEAYTRAGALDLDAQRAARHQDGGLTVLGDGGPITVPPNAEVSIAPDGTVSAKRRGGQPMPVGQAEAGDAGSSAGARHRWPVPRCGRRAAGRCQRAGAGRRARGQQRQRRRDDGRDDRGGAPVRAADEAAADRGAAGAAGCEVAVAERVEVVLLGRCAAPGIVRRRTAASAASFPAVADPTRIIADTSAKDDRRTAMIRSLWIAKTGMEAQQTQLDTIAHNLANVGTNGFKRGHAVFEDLIYQNLRQAGASQQRADAAADRPAGRPGRAPGRHHAQLQPGQPAADRQQPRPRDQGQRLLPDPAARRHHRLHPRRLVPGRRATASSSPTTATSCSPASRSRRTRRA